VTETRLLDWTSSLSRALRISARIHADEREPLADSDYIDHVENLSTEEQRRENSERLLRLRRAS
jgi:hypothetical protein